MAPPFLGGDLLRPGRSCAHDDDDAIVVDVESSGPKLLDRVRQAIRVRHFSRRTEEAYVHWIRVYIVFHGKVHPELLGAAHVSAFISWLAERRRVSASTQNQALSAVLFLYRAVLAIDLQGFRRSFVRERQSGCPLFSAATR